MIDLSKFNEVTDMNFDGENPHLAICHELQGYSANGRPQAVLTKGALNIGEDLIKSMTNTLPEEVLTKMSVQNKRDSLDKALTDALKTAMEREYIYLHVIDFNEDLVAFEFEDNSYAVGYKIDENGKVEFTTELRQVERKQMFVDTETGEELIKAATLVELFNNPESEDENSSELDGEDNETPEGEEEESMDLQELQKSAEFQELVKAQAEAMMDELQKAAEKKELEANTTELVKGMSFVAEESVELLVKAVVEGDAGQELLKSLTAANEELVKANEKVESLEAELVKAKEDFATQSSVQAPVKAPVTTGDSGAARTAQLADIVKAKLAQK